MNTQNELFGEIIEKSKRNIDNLSKKEIEHRKGHLTFLNDVVLDNFLSKEKNQRIVIGLVNSINKIYGIPPIPKIEKAVVQKRSLFDSVFGESILANKQMIADYVGNYKNLIITIEGQIKKQDDFAVRSTLTSSNVMREGLRPGASYKTAANVIGLNLLGFKMDNFLYKREYITRIVRTDYDYPNKYFLESNYSDYYLELPKIPKNKNKLEEKYHDSWDFAKVLKAQHQSCKEVMKMGLISNENAIYLLEEFYNSLKDDELVQNALTKQEAETIYLNQMEQVKLQSLQQGREQGIERTALNMISEGLGKELIAKIVNKPISWVEQLQKEIQINT